MKGWLVALLEARVAARRARIVAALGDMGVEAVVDGDDVRASVPGLAGRWWRDRALRDVGRDGR